MEDLSQHSTNPTQTLIYNSITSSSLSSSSSPPYPNPNPNPPQPQPQPQPQPDTLIKSKIISHPHFSALLAAYVDCHRVGAPTDVASRISALAHAPFQVDHLHPSAADPEPELDHFMDVYCKMLVKYQEELTRPLKEAIDFFARVESQLDSLINDNPAREKSVVCSSEENQGGTEISEIDSIQADIELKHSLLKKYGGCLSSLKQKLSKKKKKGKLPMDARQKLLSWWNSHHKWPYLRTFVHESEKAALAEGTGLDQKQINNWFINQRKRHWKPSEDHMQFVIDGYHSQSSDAAAFLY